MKIPNIKIILANYFDCFGENLATALSLQYIPYT
jgi:5-methyltetrahydropteroyltriglutamate--homocysteine methyltransferase